MQDTFEQRLAFVGLDKDVEARLAPIADLVERHVEGALERFNAQVSRAPARRAFFMAGTGLKPMARGLPNIGGPWRGGSSILTLPGRRSAWGCVTHASGLSRAGMWGAMPAWSIRWSGA